jgi:hypothetical protein
LAFGLLLWLSATSVGTIPQTIWMSIAEHDVFELGEDDAQQRPGAFHDQRLARLVLCEQGLQFHEARHKPTYA